mgnify:CR=1 FL=1
MRHEDSSRTGNASECLNAGRAAASAKILRFTVVKQMHSPPQAIFLWIQVSSLLIQPLPGVGGWVQKVAAEDLGFMFFSVRSPYFSGKKQKNTDFFDFVITFFKTNSDFFDILFGKNQKKTLLFSLFPCLNLTLRFDISSISSSELQIRTPL